MTLAKQEPIYGYSELAAADIRPRVQLRKGLYLFEKVSTYSLTPTYELQPLQWLTDGPDADVWGRPVWIDEPEPGNMSPQIVATGPGQTLASKDVSLFKVDFGAAAHRVRFFVPNKAFRAKASHLRDTNVSCTNKVGSSVENYEVSMPSDDPKLRGSRRRDFVFKEGPGGGSEVGKTYRTYNPKPL